MICFLLPIISLCGAPPGLIPEPLHKEFNPGTFDIVSSIIVSYDPKGEGVEDVANYAAEWLRRVTGFDVPVKNISLPHGITFDIAPTEFGAEEYQLLVDSDRADIIASHRAGFFYGFMTLLQLFPDSIYSQKKVSEKLSCPCANVHDKPRFIWRGMLIDVCRHWFGVETIKRILDGMAINKLNIMHWHLTEDTAWRIEIKKYPLLTTVGSIRRESSKPWHIDQGDGVPYGPFFYTQDEVREVVAYAKRLSILVVPEIEMPGHSLAGLAAYPDTSCTGGPFEPVAVFTTPVKDTYCIGSDHTINFLKDVLEECFDLFDSVYIHIGGDEACKERWYTCPKCQKRVKDEGLSGTNALQSWLTKTFAQFLDSKGRRLVGWDEIIEGGPIADGAIVMSWRGTSGGQAAVAAGHEVVMTPGDHCYFDHNQFPVKEQWEYNGGILTLKQVYDHDPCAAIEADKKHFIIGTQGNMWGEYVWGGVDDLLYKVFPRAAALSEVGWTDLSKMNWNRHLTALAIHQRQRYLNMNITQAPLAKNPTAKWSGEDFESEYKSHTFDMTGAVGNSGKYTACFIATSGENQAMVKNVQLIIDGNVVSSDEHEGTISYDSNTNMYSLNVPNQISTSSKVEIKCDMKVPGGKDLTGEIFLLL